MHIKSCVFQRKPRQVMLSFINHRIDDTGNQNSAIVQNFTELPPHCTYPTSKCVSSSDTDSLTTQLASHTPNLSTINHQGKKKKEQLRGIKNVKPVSQIRLPLQVPWQLNIAQHPLTSPFRHKFVTWEEVVAVTVMRRPRRQTCCQRSLRSAH